MRFVILLCCCISLATTGCGAPPVGDNAPPVAHIVSITDEVPSGEVARFSGYGTDDGSITDYRWHSDLDGELSRSATFETPSLSVGVHSIEFTVQDNHGAWSEPAQASITITPAKAVAPHIESFTISPPALKAGQSSTLSWRVRDAASARIDPGIGTVPESGSLAVTPEGTTTYILTAINGDLMDSATATIEVDPARMMVLRAAPDLSGYVRFSGYAPYGEVWVGDDEADRGVRGFVSYYIHEIPRDARIHRVAIDMSGYVIPYDEPFAGLGCLCAFHHPYNTLQGQYRVPGFPKVLQRWCSVEELDSPLDSVVIRDLLQASLGKESLQFRFQFAERETDLDQRRDLLTWKGSVLPSLIVEYYEADD